jgi:hypothetical protein
LAELAYLGNILLKVEPLVPPRSLHHKSICHFLLSVLQPNILLPVHKLNESVPLKGLHHKALETLDSPSLLLKLGVLDHLALPPYVISEPTVLSLPRLYDPSLLADACLVPKSDPLFEGLPDPPLVHLDQPAPYVKPLKRLAMLSVPIPVDKVDVKLLSSDFKYIGKAFVLMDGGLVFSELD